MNTIESPRDSADNTCLYCGVPKTKVDFTLEHIWPASLGGKLCSDFFKTRSVCSYCNSKVGLWVDAAFIKSWFIQNEVATTIQDFLSPSKISTVPLFYLGHMENFPTAPGNVCERWAGISGEHVYHIHSNTEDKWYGYAGGDVIRRKRDGGRAYIKMTSANLYWVETALRSFNAHFEFAKRCCLTEITGAPPRWYEYIDPIDRNDPIQASEIEFINSMADKQFMARVPVRLDFSDRFLCKLAIGVGHNLLGKPFQTTGYYKLLQRALMEKSFTERIKYSIKGRNLLKSDDIILTSQLHMPGSWHILLKRLPHAFILWIVTPTNLNMSIQVSDEEQLWADSKFNCFTEGCIYIICPPGEKFVGPVKLPDYISHMLGNKKIQAIEEIQGIRKSSWMLPSKQ